MASDDASRQSNTQHKEPPPREISSSELFGDARRILIRHDSMDYFLTITRQGKLILTK